MKTWIKVKATALTLGFVLYMFASVVLIEAAKAEEPHVYSVAKAIQFVKNDEMSWGVTYAVMSSLQGIINAEAMGLAYEMGDTSVYEPVFNKLLECTYGDRSVDETVFGVLAAPDSKTTHVGAAAYIYYTSRCSEYLGYLHTQDTKKEDTRAKKKDSST